MKYINRFEIIEVGKRLKWFFAYFIFSFPFLVLNSLFSHNIAKNIVTLVFIVVTIYFFQSKYYKKSIGIENLEFVYIKFKILKVLLSFCIGFLLWWFCFSFLYSSKIVKPISIKIIVTSILTSIVRAIYEEFLFRYTFLTKPISNKKTLIFVIIFSSLICSIFHFYITSGNELIPYLIYTFLMGVITSLLYLYTKSIWIPVAFHCSVNVYFHTIYSISSEIKDIMPYPLSTPIVLALCVLILILVFRKTVIKLLA